MLNQRCNKTRRPLLWKITLVLAFIITIWVLIGLFQESNHDKTGNNTADDPVSTELPNQITHQSANKSNKKSLEKEAEAMRNEILSRVKKLQEPEMCESADYLVCPFSLKCGLGCTSNNVIECMSHGQMEQRTVVLDTTKAGLTWWHDLFLPVSKCQQYYNQNKRKIDQDPNTFIFNGVNGVEWISHRNWVPPYTKSFCNEENMQYPTGWFLGILSGYVYRGFQPKVEEYIETKRKIFVNQMTANVSVGCHIRRTDKVTSGEAIRFELREYINDIDHLTAMRVDVNGKRIKNYHGHYDDDYDIDVYLATESMEVIDELCSNPYWKHGYNWIFDDKTVANAGKAEAERLANLNGQMDAIFDVIMLSERDYFVGTLSSNLGRLVFQLFANKYVDPSQYALSLDEKYCGRV